MLSVSGLKTHTAPKSSSRFFAKPSSIRWARSSHSYTASYSSHASRRLYILLDWHFATALAEYRKFQHRASYLFLCNVPHHAVCSSDDYGSLRLSFNSRNCSCDVNSYRAHLPVLRQRTFLKGSSRSKLVIMRVSNVCFSTSANGKAGWLPKSSGLRFMHGS